MRLIVFNLYQSFPPVPLDTWGLDTTDPILNASHNLMRRYPSPLSQYGLASALQPPKKVFNE